MGIVATPPAAATMKTFRAVMTVGLTGRADKTNAPARSRIPIATVSAMINPRILLRRRESVGSMMLPIANPAARAARVGSAANLQQKETLPNVVISGGDSSEEERALTAAV